ncbi:hypothetical protein Fmac_032051 [Flemingia macrophylla]|uniref:Uncharacterized protein n=1 Tax=Flemingia macrophylla TaxID=520843 RepID=A0ABD1L3U8_9FABA
MTFYHALSSLAHFLEDFPQGHPSLHFPESSTLNRTIVLSKLQNEGGHLRSD